VVAVYPANRRKGIQLDRGSASLEIAILGPALLLLIFGLVQAALWFYARNLALAAAQEGADAARGYQASTDAGVTRAESFLQRAAGDSLQSATVSSSGSTPTTVRIEVRGRSLSVIPGLPGLPVFQFAQVPVERFTVNQP
jgi:Flp pilus assembly protein TadG